MSIADREAFHAFLCDSWVTWLVADATPEKGGDRSAPPRSPWGASPLRTQLLFTAWSKLVAANSLPSTFTFDAETRSLQFARSSFRNLVKRNEAHGVADEKRDVPEDVRDQVLHDKNGLAKRVIRLMRYWGTEWQENKIDWSRILPQRLIAETEKLFMFRISDVQFPGVLLNGYDNGKHVWTLRSPDEVCSLTNSCEFAGAVDAFFALTPRDRFKLLGAATDRTSVSTALPTLDWALFTHQRPEGQCDGLYDLLVLRALNAICWLDLEAVPRELLEKTVDHLSRNTPLPESTVADRCGDALLRLCQQTWIVYVPPNASLQDANWRMTHQLPIGFDEIIPNMLNEEFTKETWEILLKAVLNKSMKHDDLLDAADVLDEWFAHDSLLRSDVASALIKYTEFVPPSPTRESLVRSAAGILRRFDDERAGAKPVRVRER